MRLSASTSNESRRSSVRVLGAAAAAIVMVAAGACLDFDTKDSDCRSDPTCLVPDDAGGGGGGDSGTDAGADAGTDAAGLAAITLTLAPGPVVTGTCAAGSVAFFDDAGMPFIVGGDTPVQVESADDDGGFFVFVDSVCGDAGMPVVSAGASNVPFSARAVRSGARDVIASVGAIQSDRVKRTDTPNVLSGNCNLGSGNSYPSCALGTTVDLATSFLVYAAAGGGNNPGEETVQCQLTSQSIECFRPIANGPAQLNWYVVQLPSRVKVQRLDAPCVLDAGTVMPLSQAIDPLKSFVLFSASAGSTGYDRYVGALATLAADGASVVVHRSEETLCPPDAGYVAQVVTFEGSSVARGSVSMPTGVKAATDPVLTADVGRSFLLYSWLVGPTAPPNACQRMLRGTVTQTQVRFTRGFGNMGINGECDGPVIDAGYELVTLPSGNVQAFDVRIDAGEAMYTLPISEVDPDRTVVLSGAQSFFGAGGSGELYTTTDQAAGMVFLPQLTDPTTIQITRESTGTTSTGRTTLFVIEFEP